MSDVPQGRIGAPLGGIEVRAGFPPVQADLKKRDLGPGLASPRIMSGWAGKVLHSSA